MVAMTTIFILRMNCLHFSYRLFFCYSVFSWAVSPHTHFTFRIYVYFNIIISKANQHKSTTAVHSKAKELVVLSVSGMFKTSVQRIPVE